MLGLIVHTYVYAKLPKTGLCNMLFVWARAEVIRLDFGFQMLAPQWFKFARIGPLIRGEKDKRYYVSDFCSRGYVRGWRRLAILAGMRRVDEKELGGIVEAGLSRRLIVCQGMEDGFRPFLNRRQDIYDALRNTVNPKIREAVDLPRPPFIGIHVRRGDFKQAGQIIPLEWYRNAADQVRLCAGEEWPIRVFTDEPDQVGAVFSGVPNCSVQAKAPAVQDLLILSSAEYIIGTSLSTFSLWASFLQQRKTVWPPVSPGVRGYGLSTCNHISSDWEGRLREFKQF